MQMNFGAPDLNPAAEHAGIRITVLKMAGCW